MLTSHELFGFMTPALAVRIIEFAHDTNRDLYRSAMSTTAETRKLRPLFFERMPKSSRHTIIAQVCAKPRMELLAANLLREWLLKKQTPMLCDFLDSLGVKHKEGSVDDLPPEIEEGKLKAAVENLLSKYPAEEVSVYLNAFFTMNDVRWKNLETMLKNEPRLQFGG